MHDILNRLTWSTEYRYRFYRETKNVVRIVPRFLFGLAREAVEEMYGPDVDNYPIIGIFTSSTKYDRFIIQGLRNSHLEYVKVICSIYSAGLKNEVRG